jgi:hypothetical protein
MSKSSVRSATGPNPYSRIARHSKLYLTVMLLCMTLIQTHAMATTISGPATVNCGDDVFYGSGNGNGSWQWSVSGAGVTIDGDSTGPYIYVRFPNAIITATISCSAAGGSVSKSVTVTRPLPFFPSSAISSDAPMVGGQPTITACGGVQFSAQVYGEQGTGYSSAWNYGDGSPADSTGIHYFTKTGSYPVAETITDTLVGASVTSPSYTINVHSGIPTNTTATIVSYTVYSTYHDITTCVNTPVTASFFAYCNNAPASSCEGSVTGPIWAWGGNGDDTVTQTFTSVGDFLINDTATATYTLSGHSPIVATGTGSVTVHVVDDSTWGSPINKVEPHVSWSCDTNGDAIPSEAPGSYTQNKVTSCGGITATKTCHLSYTDNGVVQVGNDYYEQFAESDDCHGPEDGQTYNAQPGVCCCQP